MKFNPLNMMGNGPMGLLMRAAKGGSFRLRGSVACAPNNALAGLDGTAPTAPAEGGGGA